MVERKGGTVVGEVDEFASEVVREDAEQDQHQLSAELFAIFLPFANFSFKEANPLQSHTCL